MMKILKFTQHMLKISAMQPLYDGGIVGKFIEMLKLIMLTLPVAYVLIASIAFIIINIDKNMSLVAEPIYVLLGSGISVSLSILFYFQNEKVTRLLKNIEFLVNESESRAV